MFVALSKRNHLRLVQVCMLLAGVLLLLAFVCLRSYCMKLTAIKDVSPDIILVVAVLATLVLNRLILSDYC